VPRTSTGLPVLSGGTRPPFARRRLVAAAVLVLAAIALGIALSSGGEVKGPPLPGIGRPARAGDPFAYSADREASFIARGTAGNAHVLFTASPGGALATAARVAALRPMITAAANGSGIDPNLLEAIVFVESAGRPDAMAGPDPSAAAGLTQILAATGQSLLGMHIDLAASRKLVAAVNNAQSVTQANRLLGRLARADDRFNPRKALAATVRYLELARARFGRADLAIVSYHMGIGNLQQVLGLYDGGADVPYAQLYFDTAPDRHGDAFRLLSSFGDQSSLYYWRVLGAATIMRLYRTDRAALRRLDTLQTGWSSSAMVLHPPDRTQAFASPQDLSSAYASRTLLPLPANAAALGLRYDPAIGAQARKLGAPPALYRGLRGPALDLLIELAARVRALSGTHAPLTVAAAVSDQHYQQQAGFSDWPASTGYSFSLARRYASGAQAAALQAMLDRLQALNLIAWTRYAGTIEVTVAAGASRAIVDGP
jgi:soluble lytic murein transglycosylase-like protein